MAWPITWQGYCENGYLRGWDGKGAASQSACNDVCLAEPDCTHAAYNTPRRACARYKEASCQLKTSDKDHYTFKKAVPVTKTALYSPGCCLNYSRNSSLDESGPQAYL